MASQTSEKQTAPLIAREKIFIEILRDIEDQRLVPGQRLIETELVLRFGVSRNVVREGIQLLAGRGIVDLSPNKSPAIRRLSLEEAMGVLDISLLLTGLLVRLAAENYSAKKGARLAAAMAELDAVKASEEKEFSRAQRHIVTAMMELCENVELRRIYPMAGMAVFTAQFRSSRLVQLQKECFHQMHAAIIANDAKAAERAGHASIEQQRIIVQQFFT